MNENTPEAKEPEMARCPHCGKRVQMRHSSCPHCGDRLKNRTYPPLLILGLVMFAIPALIFVSGALLLFAMCIGR
jgi:ribosomal protein L37AE/L43A